MDQGQKRPSLFPSRNARRGTTCCSGHSLEILSPTTTGALVRPGRRQTRADAGLRREAWPLPPDPRPRPAELAPFGLFLLS